MTQLLNKNRIENENPKDLDALITDNSRLVVVVANRFNNNGLSLLELIQAGNIGLINAADRFDESSGYEFENYAIWFIRQSIIQAIMEKEIEKPIPLNKIGLFSRTQYSFIRPDHYLLHEPARRDMEFINKYKERLSKGTIQANKRYSHV